MLKPSDELSRELRRIENELPAGGNTDDIRAKLICKISDLRQLGTRGKRGAWDDLNAVGYFHVQPCYCKRCSQ